MQNNRMPTINANDTAISAYCGGTVTTPFWIVGADAKAMAAVDTPTVSEASQGKRWSANAVCDTVLLLPYRALLQKFS